MAKRKRGTDAEMPDEDASVEQRRLQHKLKIGTTKLGHAFKVAKGFERQKLSRRRKTAAAQSNDKDVDRIDSEVAALKTLDTFTAAQHHFYKTLMKTKPVADHPDLPEQIKIPIKLPLDSATLNINARLCKSNPVKESLAAAVGEIRHALGIEAERPTSVKKRRLRAKDYEGAASDVDAIQREPESARNGVGLSPAAADTGGGEEDLASLNSRIAGSSDEASHVKELERRGKVDWVREAPAASARYDIEADLSISGSDFDSRSNSPEPRKAPALKKSSFLPALTMGGYISGSGSDIDDSDVAPRRNRRGQRARQWIWEQKHGSKAKHLQNQDRNKGWDLKRGATDGTERRRGARNVRRSGPDYNHGARTEHNNSRSGLQEKKKHKDDEGSIHPSWEAAKRAKENKIAPVAFQGRKITFD